MNSSPVPAVIISHPGHELRVHHWLEQAKPAVCVLTDGSGHTQRSRLDSTTGVLSGAGFLEDAAGAEGNGERVIMKS